MKKINLFDKMISPLSDGKGCPVERGGVWELPRRTPCATPSWKEGDRKVPSYRRRPVSGGFNRGGGIPLFSGMTVRICGMMIAIAALFATPSFAEPTELDKKTVASKAYVDTKQDIIETGLVDYYSGADDETKKVPALVSYDSTNGLVGNEIGILDWYNTDNDGWYSLTSSEMDNFVPTVRAVADVIKRLNWITNDTTYAPAINAYSTTFNGTVGNWPSGDVEKLVNGQFLAKSLALKQNKIETGNVAFDEEEDIYVPGLVAYDPQTSALSGNKIGILDQETIADDEGDLYLYSNGGGGYGSEMDNYVPTVRAVAESLQAIRSGLATKQNKLPAKFTSTTNANEMGAKGGQTIELDTAGNIKRRYITADGNAPLTLKSGADNVISYVNGTTSPEGFRKSNFGGNISTTTVNYMQGALVSLRLLRDVYGELNSKITNNALPTGTTGTVVTYNGTNATTGVQEFTETAISGTATYDDNDQLTNGNNIANVSLVETEIATRQKKRTCAGYEPGHENEADYCWLWNFPD